MLRPKTRPPTQDVWEGGAPVSQRLPCPEDQIVCADDVRCSCSRSEHLADVDRAVDEISRQAARLAIALTWIFAVAALVVLFVLVA